MKDEIAEIVAVIIAIVLIAGVTGLIMWGLSSMFSNMEYGVKQGIVIDKDYRGAHTYTSYQTSYVGNSTIRIPYQEYVGEMYRIRIEKVEDGKTKNRWFEVTAEEYNNLQIGDRYGGYEGE